MKRRCYIAIFFAMVSFFWGCGKEVAGTATQTENTIAGTVIGTDGAAVKSAIVRMAMVAPQSSNIQIPEYQETITDSLGSFIFKEAIADTFQLAVIAPNEKEIVYIPRVSKNSSVLDEVKLNKAAVLNSSLEQTTSIISSINVGSHFLVYIPGLPFFESVFSSDEFSMLIPEGTWWLAFCPGDQQVVEKLKESGVSDTVIYRSWEMDKEVKVGDSLEIGPFVWGPSTEVDEIIRVLDEVGRISGKVTCDGKPCSGVDVSLITDIYGFNFTNGDSLEVLPIGQTDNQGRWFIPAPLEVPEDSFRVEFKKVIDGKTYMGSSRYIKFSEVEKLKDTLYVESSEIEVSTAVELGVLLSFSQDELDESKKNCMMNTVVIGVKGTSRFFRTVTCNTFTIKNVPSGIQQILHYSGESMVVSALQEKNIPLSRYVFETTVTLTQGQSIEQLWLTYAPPMLN